MSSTTTAQLDPEIATHQRDTNRLTGADGLRAFAALWVVFSHLYQRLNLYEQPEWLQTIQVLMMKGAFGVSIFFVLSGMLLSYPFWTAYVSGGAYPRIGHYAKRRFARIAPGFYASLIVSFVVAVALWDDIPAQWWRLASGFTFTSGFYWLTLFPVESNGPLWSISFEVVSYVLMPLAMLGLFAIRKRARGIGLGYWLLTFGVIIAVNQWVITTFVTSDEGKGWSHGLTGGAKSWVPDYNPVGFFGHFTLGIMAAAVIAMWKVRGGGRAWWWDLVALVGLGGAAWLTWAHRLPPEPDRTTNFQNQPYLFPAFAALIALALVGLAHSRLLGRLVDNRFARYTATVSFGIYIWHYLVLHLMSYVTDGQFEYFGISNPAKHTWISVAVLLITYAVASASWFLLEKPILYSRWATQTSSRRHGART